MNAKFSSYLSGFSGFGRSFNRSVLAHDFALHKEYKAALNSGSLPCNRLRILTVGDKGVGKTSTLQHLQGQVCDPDAEPQTTEGIEITVCETSDREPSWKPCKNGVCDSADDPSLCAAWCVCAGVDSMKGVLRNCNDNSTSVDAHIIPQGPHHRRGFGQRSDPCTSAKVENLSHAVVSQALRGIILCFAYQVKLILPLFVLFLVFSYITNDFGVLCWLAIFLSVPFVFKSDFNSSYRFVPPFAFQLVTIEVVIDVKGYLLSEGNNHDPDGLLWMPEFVIKLILYLGVLIIEIVFGLLCGLGCRSGAAAAFCLMTHELSFQPRIKGTFGTVVALVVGNLTGLLVLRNGFQYIQKLARNQTIVAVSLVASVVCLAITNYRSLTAFLEDWYISDVLLGIPMGILYPYGVMKGREFVAVRKLMLPYILKKAFGFGVAIVIGYLIGWRFLILSETSTPVSIVCSTLATCGFPVYDWIVARRIKALEKENIPVTTFRQFLMDAATQDNPVGLKLQFWDNAGDSVYQTMQQFFRPAEAVYLLVFNLVDAREDGDLQIQHLCQWLFTVKAHSKNPNTLVFIVGTHRDSVTEEFIASFATDIDDKLYRDFCSILAINGDKGPLYVVENSKLMDGDGVKLRQSIISVAKKTPFMKELFPIRHLNILKRIQDGISENSLPWIKTTSELLSEIAEKGMSLEELRKILVSLNRTGDVIYRDDDSVLMEYVVIRPQNLLDVLKALVRIPPKASRSLSEADDWVKMEEQGIVSLNLIESLIGSIDALPCVMRLMEAYGLLIPVYTTPSSSSPSHQPAQDKDAGSSFSLSPAIPSSETVASKKRPNYFMVPSHLPEYTVDDTSFWEPSEDDEEYFFDFGYFTAVIIFHRLLAKCWNDDDFDAQMFRTRGCFRFHGKIFYAIQLQKVSISQNTIRVTILHDSCNRCSLQVLQFLHHLVEDIRRRDFPNLPYACGPVCCTCSSESFLRVLKVCGHDKRFPTDDKPPEAFIHEGKYHKVQLTPQLKVTCGRQRSSSSTSSVSSQDTSSCHDLSSSKSISVGEGSQGVTVINAGDNSTFDIYPTNSLQGPHCRKVDGRSNDAIGDAATGAAAGCADQDTSS